MLDNQKADGFARITNAYQAAKKAFIRDLDKARAHCESMPTPEGKSRHFNYYENNVGRYSCFKNYETTPTYRDDQLAISLPRFARHENRYCAQTLCRTNAFGYTSAVFYTKPKRLLRDLDNLALEQDYLSDKGFLYRFHKTGNVSVFKTSKKVAEGTYSGLANKLVFSTQGRDEKVFIHEAHIDSHNNIVVNVHDDVLDFLFTTILTLVE